MSNIIQSIKNEIYSNNKINWSAVLFLLSEPIALVAAYFIILRGLHAINFPNTFTMTTFYTVIFTTIGYIFRVPYMWNKPSAIFFLLLNIIMWIIAISIWTNAFLKYNKDSKDNKNSKDSKDSKDSKNSKDNTNKNNS